MFTRSMACWTLGRPPLREKGGGGGGGYYGMLDIRKTTLSEGEGGGGLLWHAGH